MVKLDKKAVSLLFGILNVFLCYLLFNSQQYFSLAAMASIFVMLICGLFFLMLPNFIANNGISSKNIKNASLALVFVSAISAIFESYFYLHYSRNVSGSLLQYSPVIIAALIPILAMYLIRNRLKELKSYRPYAIAAIAIVVLSVAAFYVLSYALHGMNWKGTDEMVYDYYASYLLYRGMNPYTTSMQYILNKYNITYTLQLNGSCACRYGYPSLSFIPFLAIQALGMQNLYVFVYVAVICTIFAAFMVYYKSKFNTYILLLLFVFLLLAYINRPGGNTKYLAISVLLLIAYIERRRAYVQGAFLGLAAATHQLAWIAIPFFYLLTLRESGKSSFLKCVLLSVFVFLLANSYFLLVSPKATIGGLLYLFAIKMQIQGPNIMQFLMAFYPVPYWFTTVTLAIIYIACLIVFYLYTDSFKPLIALAPATILFLSRANESIYFIPFIPIMLYIYYADERKCKDLLGRKRYVLAIVLPVIIALVLVLVVSHTSFVKEATLQITKITYTIQKRPNGTSSLFGLQVYVKNNNNRNESVLFYVLSRNPDNETYITTYGSISPGFTGYFNLSYQNINNTIARNGTKFYIYVLSNDYYECQQIKVLPVG